MELKSILGKTRVVFFVALPLYGGNYKTEGIDIRYQLSPEDGEVSPITRYPYYWNSRKYSSIEYSNFSTTEVKEDSEFYDKMSLSLERKEVTLNLIGYDYGFGKIIFSPELSFNYIGIEKNEFGFDIQSNSEDTLFDNEVELDVFRLRVGSSISGTIGKNFTISLEGILYPYSQMEVEQTIMVRPHSNDITTVESTNNLDMAYEIRFSTLYNFTDSWSAIAIFEQNILPLQYDAVYSYQNGKALIKEFDEEHKVSTWMIKAVTPLQISGNSRFSFGYGQRIIEIDSGDAETENIISFGIDTIF
jgi:hypothetical protein